MTKNYHAYSENIKIPVDVLLSEAKKSKKLIKDKLILLRPDLQNNIASHGIINPGAISVEGEIVLLCRGEPHSKVGYNCSLSSQAIPLWCVFDKTLKLKRSTVFKYDYLPNDHRPEDWRLFKYKQKLYSNHTIYYCNQQNKIQSSMAISEIDISKKNFS